MRCVCWNVALLILTTASCLSAYGLDVRRIFHEKRENSTDTAPAPIVVPPSQYFDGIDGSWSTFNIRVGTPPQSVRVIASTNSPATLVVRPQGCLIGAIPNGVPTNCDSSRGGTFNSDSSRSWIDQGWFTLHGANAGYESNLGYNFMLDYGLDTVGLGYRDGDAPTLKNQTISAYDLPNPLYLGLFGLGTQPLIYTTFGNYSVPSYFVSLRNQSIIPSLSWSYTAGASYRLAAGQYAQLIFGGYDTSRFQTNDVQFYLSADVTRDIVVGVQSILYTGSTSSALLSEPIYAFIESTDPNIWLPLSACLQFEEAFGLTYDNETQKYLMNTTQYTALSATNPSVTFRLASSTTGGSTVDIVLPFNAFGLKAAYPFIPESNSNSTYYFPLQRAANETQYTLGRAFLQEAYLTVDYDRGNFSVSQCTWQQSATPQVASIIAPVTQTNNTNSTTNHSAAPASKKSTATPAIAGAVATVAVVACLAALGFYFWRRRKHQKRGDGEGGQLEHPAPVILQDLKTSDPKMDGEDLDETGSMFGRYKKDNPPASVYRHREPEGEPRGELPGHEIYEIGAEAPPSEMGDSNSRIRFELATPVPVEMEGSSHWEAHEMPSPIPSPFSGRNPRSGHLSQVSSFGSVASTTNLLNSPSTWNSVSSKVIWRSAGPTRSNSTIEEDKPLDYRPD